MKLIPDSTSFDQINQWITD